MTALSAETFLDLIGAPFVLGARGPAAYDCVGLVVEIQRRRGFDVPRFISCEAELHRQLVAGGALAECELLDRAEAGAVALVRMVDGEAHLGVMVDPFRMLHTTAQTGGAVLERILGPLWAGRILGFYRLREPYRPGANRVDTARPASPGLGFFPDPDEAAR